MTEKFFKVWHSDFFYIWKLCRIFFEIVKYECFFSDCEEYFKIAFRTHHNYKFWRWLDITAVVWCLRLRVSSVQYSRCFCIFSTMICLLLPWIVLVKQQVFIYRLLSNLMIGAFFFKEDQSRNLFRTRFFKMVFLNLVTWYICTWYLFIIPLIDNTSIEYYLYIVKTIFVWLKFLTS